MTAQYDDIIVGAGSAGAVIASRLSEDPSRRVLLIEAGPDYMTRDETPTDIRYGRSMSFQDHDWGFRADARDGKKIRYPRGKVTGGSSCVGATVALRGTPEDYDAWAAAGNPSWAFSELLPYFRKLEDDKDFGGEEYHGQGGPFPIRRWRESEVEPGQLAFIEACLEAGFPEEKDHNSPESTGVGPIPSNRWDLEYRATTANAYLDQVRQRPNLEIRAQTMVDRVVFEGSKATGLFASTAGGDFELIEGRRIILAAGAVSSPMILMRSGIGSREELRRHGIDCRADLPGVGQNLIDHLRTGAFLVPRPEAYDPTKAFLQEILRTTSPISGHFNDLQYYMVNHFSLDPFPELQMLSGATDIIGVMAVLQQPDSRGRLTLASADPLAPPEIALNFLATEKEIDILVDGVRTAWRLASHPGIRSLGQGYVVLRESTIDNDNMVRQYVKTSLESVYHPVGTVRMGPADDTQTVVSERGAVHGLESLYVCDASIMPGTVCANTNVTTIMIGERMADWLREG